MGWWLGTLWRRQWLRKRRKGQEFPPWRKGYFGADTPSWGGKGADHGKGKEAKGKGKGKGKVATKPKPPEWDCNADRGTYIICPKKSCQQWIFYDKAGSGCELCGTAFNFHQFWDGKDCRTAAARREEESCTDIVLVDADMGSTDTGTPTEDAPVQEPSAEAAAPAAPKGKGKGSRWGPQETSEDQAVNEADGHLKKARTAVDSAINRVAAEERAMADMAAKLKRQMEVLNEYVERMRARQPVVLKYQEELAAAYRVQESAGLARDAANKKRTEAQQVLIHNSVRLIAESVGLSGAGAPAAAAGGNGAATGKGMVKVEPGLGKGPGTAPTGEPATAPAPPADNNGAAQPLPLADVAPLAGAPAPFPDSEGKMDRICYGDDEMCSEDSGSDNETSPGTEVDGLELDEWKEHMVSWVFQATYGEPAPRQLVHIFCGDGEGSAETEAALGLVVDQIRNALWIEQQGEANDLAKILECEATGDMVAAYNMRVAQGLYASDKLQQMRAGLLVNLDFALSNLKNLRQAKVEDGSFVAAKGVHYKLKTRAGVAPGKGSAAKGTGGGKGSQETARKITKKATKKEIADTNAEKEAKVRVAKDKVSASSDIQAAAGENAADVVAELGAAAAVH